MMMQKSGVKILRPRQLYVGEGKRDYVEIAGREAAPVALGSEPTPASLTDVLECIATADNELQVPHVFSQRAFLAEYKDKTRSSKL